MNSFKLAGLALAALFCSACTDHGPVGILSKELFNKDIPPARIEYNSASAVSFTTSAGFASSASNGALAVSVYLANNGGSSTYGPIQIDFSASDPNFNFVMSAGLGEAFAYTDSHEVPADPGKHFTPLRGYRQSGQNYVVDANNSFQFWYNNPGGIYNLAGHSVTITMVIQDSLGNSWSSQFLIYITT